MEQLDDLGLNAPEGSTAPVTRPATPPWPSTATSRRQGPPPVSADTAPAGMTSAMAPVRSDDPALHPALQKMV
jgi:hypothetical protein